MQNEIKIKLKSIKGYNSFNFNFSKSKKIYHSNAILAFRNSEELETATIQFGVSISKKNAKKAVIRNRVKRLMRESLRQIIADNDYIFNFNTIILIWKSAPKMQSLIKLNDVKSVIIDLLNEANSKVKMSK